MSSAYRDSRSVPVDKIFFALACVYLGFVVAYLVERNRAIARQPTPPALSATDRQFIAYLRSSLELIDRQALSPLPSPPAVKTEKIPSPRTIERVYVPVYSPPSPDPSPHLKRAPVPSPPPLAPTVAVPKIPAVSPPPPLAPTVAVPKRPAVSLPPPAAVPVPSPEPSEQLTLTGVVELDERSAALFDARGVTTRVSIGESIAGWTLVEVRDRRITLTRDGETKVLEVGRVL